MKKQADKKQAKKFNTRPKKKSIDFQLKLAQAKFDRLEGLKSSATEYKKKKINRELKVLKRKLKRLIKSRLKKAPKNLRQFETAKKKLDSFILIINKDLKILNGKIRLSESQLKKLRKEKIRINRKREDFEKSLEKIKEKISEEKRIRGKLKLRFLR